MLTRPVLCLCLMTLILMTSAAASQRKQRQRGRRQKDEVTSRGSSRNNDWAVKGHEGVSVADRLVSSAAAAAAVDDMESKTKATKCKDCFLAPAVSIKVSRSRRHRLRHRGRHRSRGGNRGRSDRRQPRPRGTESSGTEPPQEDGALAPPSSQEGVPDPSGKSAEPERISKSSKSARRRKPPQLSNHQRSSQTPQGDEQGADGSGSREGERRSEQALSDQGSLTPPSSARSGPGSDIGSKKNSGKQKKGRRKSKKGKSSGGKKSKKNSQKEQSESPSLWSMFSFWSPEKSGDSEEPSSVSKEEKSAAKDTNNKESQQRQSEDVVALEKPDDSAEPSEASEEKSAKAAHREKDSEKAQRKSEQDKAQEPKPSQSRRRQRGRKRSRDQQKKSRGPNGDEERRHGHNTRRQKEPAEPSEEENPNPPRRTITGFNRRRQDGQRIRTQPGKDRASPESDRRERTGESDSSRDRDSGARPGRGKARKGDSGQDPGHQSAPRRQGELQSSASGMVRGGKGQDDVRERQHDVERDRERKRDREREDDSKRDRRRQDEDDSKRDRRRQDEDDSKRDRRRQDEDDSKRDRRRQDEDDGKRDRRRQDEDDGKRDRELQEDKKRDRQRQDDGKGDRERQDAENRERHLLISRLNRRRQDLETGRRREGEDRDDRRDRKHQVSSRRDRQRQDDDRRDRGRPDNDRRHDRGRQQYGAGRRDRDPRHEETRRERERLIAMRLHERERHDDYARQREKERQEGIRRRHRQRQEELRRRDKQRQDELRRERERQIAARRERERQEYVRRERQRKEYARRQRERLGHIGGEEDAELPGGGVDAPHSYSRGRYHHHPGHSSAYDYPRRPAAADRLEGRLFPDVRSHTRSLLRSMQRALSALTGGLQAVRNTNQFVFNGTRYNIMMGVRKQLSEIAKANDIVYDTILRATLLTKDIYMRAHQHRLTGPTTRSLDRPEMSLPSLYDIIRAAYDEERKAQQMLRTVQGIKRQRRNEGSRLQQVREKFQDNFARNDLRTLVYYVNSTVQKLGTELTASTRVAYLKRNMGMLSNSRGNLTVARDLIYKASDILAKGMADYRGNYRVIQDWRRHRNDEDQGVGPPVSIRHRNKRSVSRRRRRRRHRHRNADQPMRDLTAAERARLRPIIDRVKRHAREQERLALQIERILRPSIISGQSALARKDDAAKSAWLSSLASRVQKDAKKMISLLESIRVLIGAKQELRWMLTSGGGACAEDGDNVEGSGCDEEGGSGELVLEGGGGEEEEGSGDVLGPTDDEDFVFVDENEAPKKKKKAGPTSLVEFGEKLSVYVDGVHLRSRDVLERGDRLFEKTEKLSERWSEMKESYNKADRARRLWKQTKDVMENVTSYADDISDVAAVFSEEISRSYDSIKSRTERAVEIAERKLAEAQAQKGGGEKGDDAEEAEEPANDDTVIVDALEKVEKVKTEMGVVRSLRQVTPQSCGRASGQLVKLHANISHLRQQVHTAKALLQDMQLAISKSGSGYLSIPVSERVLAPTSPHSRFQPTLRSPSPTTTTPVSMVTRVEVCVRTRDVDGPVLLVKGNNSASFSVSMSGRQISVTVYDDKGYDQGSVTSDVTMKEDTWYNVKVIRTGKRIVLRVTSRDGSEPAVDNDVSVSAMTNLQPTPVHVYVGGVAENEPFSVGSDSWRGCLAELRVDGRSVPLFHTSSTGETPQICSTQCGSSDDSHSLVFDGTGFVHFPASVLPMRRRMQSIHFRFRSRQPTAALLHLVNKRQRFLLRVMLANGALMIDTNTPSESIALRSQTNSYNDGVFHTLKIQYRDSTTYPEIDGQDGAFTIERSRPQNVNNMADGIVIGSFVTGSLEFEKSKYRPFMGCLQALEIDDKPLSVTQAMTSVGVFSGSCDSQSLWQECVQFGEDSTGIDLGALDRSGTVLLLFSWSAMGPLLTYSREGKFEAEVSAIDGGLQVSTEEEDLTITKPDDVTDDFILLTVTDDGKLVKYSAWGQEVKTGYGGFWDARSEVDTDHQIQIGAALDEASDRRLFGKIAQVMVGQRLINLTNYTTSSKLSACERPLPELVVVETPPPEATTVSPDDKNTCSRDIQC